MHRRHHHRTIAAIVMVFALLALATLVFAAEDKTVAMLGGVPDKVTLTEPEAQFLALANAARKAENLPELVIAPVLVTAAREKSKEMCDLKYWGHESPIKEKRTAMRRVLFHLPKPPLTMTVGENLCFMSKLAVEDGHTALMNSPTHRRNILNPAYRYVGLGSHIAEDGRTWVTQLFLDIKY